MGEHDMQNNEHDDHEHDSNNRNVFHPFETAKTPTVNSAIVIVFQCESSKTTQDEYRLRSDPCYLGDCPVVSNVSEEHLPVADLFGFRKTGFRHEMENSVLGIVFHALTGVK
jgi:hypothetical protein